jgi:uncharacterized protein (TIGR02145 family)
MKNLIIILAVILTTVTSFPQIPQKMVVQKTDGSNMFLDMNTIKTINFIIPCPGTPTVDYAGKIYNTVLIGNQCWLKENLDVGTMIDGNQTPDPTPGGTIEKYCYGNDIANCSIYGGLYQWYEAMNYDPTPGSQGICPEGWHIPTIDEFVILQNYIGYDHADELKAVGQGTGNNLSGFSAFMAGARYTDTNFGQLTQTTFFFSSNGSFTSVEYLYLYASEPYILFISNAPTNGLSVRCLKN